jgi:hypothetical protein
MNKELASMKTAELTGAELDYWVAKAAGISLKRFKDGGSGNYYWCHDWMENDLPEWAPSKLWSQGGPIIEREGINLSKESIPGFYTWMAQTTCDGPCYVMSGETALIAAMRAYVASVFGEEVPDELTSTGKNKESEREITTAKSVKRIYFNANAVIIQLFPSFDVDGNPCFGRAISISCIDQDMLPALRDEAAKMMRTP